MAIRRRSRLGASSMVAAVVRSSGRPVYGHRMAKMVTLSYWPVKRVDHPRTACRLSPVRPVHRHVSPIRTQVRHAARRRPRSRRVADHRIARAEPPGHGVREDHCARPASGRGDGLHPQSAGRRTQVQAQPDGRGARARHLGRPIPADRAGADRGTRRGRLPADPGADRLRRVARGRAPQHDDRPPARRHRDHRPRAFAGGPGATAAPWRPGRRDLGPQRPSRRHGSGVLACESRERGSGLPSGQGLGSRRHRHRRRPPGLAAARGLPGGGRPRRADRRGVRSQQPGTGAAGVGRTAATGPDAPGGLLQLGPAGAGGADGGPGPRAADSRGSGGLRLRQRRLRGAHGTVADDGARRRRGHRQAAPRGSSSTAAAGSRSTRG